MKNESVQLNQFWRDSQNKDLLRVDGFSLEPIQSKGFEINADGTFNNCIEYVRCACFVHGAFFGIQEMRKAHFDSERFVLVGKVKSIWYQWKFRREGKAA